MRLRKPLSVGLCLLAFTASCVQILGDHPYSAEEQAPPQPCQADTDCDDQNECTSDSCTDKNICAFLAKPNGTLSAQISGDCLRVECFDGSTVIQQDPADTPDDNEPCTADSCDGSAPVNIALPDTTPCQRGDQTGTCAMGVCQIACGPSMPCDDKNPCTEDSCDSGTSTCIFTNLNGSPTPGAVPILGDCKAQLCLGGKDTTVNDDADAPNDGNSCTDDTCKDGEPSNVATAAGTPCMPGGPSVCDGKGQCAQCTLPAHCVGIVETDCIKRDCDVATNTCKQKFLGSETNASMQVVGDCKRSVCNGVNGGTVAVNDDTDKPNDSNACTTDSCLSGTKVFTPVAQGTSCGAPKVCNAMGQCVGCNAPTDCPGTDDFCKQRTCMANICGVSFTANNTALPAANQTAKDCKAIVCDGAGNTKIIADMMDLPPPDNFQCTLDTCTAAGMPSYPSAPLGTPCTENGGDLCNGMAVCKKANGKSCGAPLECLNSNCVDAVCCNQPCTGICQACNLAGSIGTCSNVASGQTDNTCMDASLACDGAGGCKKQNGQGCVTAADCSSNFCVDAICCNSACNGTCMACGVPGNLGTCSPIPINQPDNSPTCNGTMACDGTGKCKLKNGEPCIEDLDCISDVCTGNPKTCL